MIKKLSIFLAILIASPFLQGQDEDPLAGYKKFKYPGLVPNGRDGYNIFDGGGEYKNFTLAEGQEPLVYVLGPLKTSPRAVIEYRAEVAVERTTADPECNISLVARNAKGKEIATGLGMVTPDYSALAPNWQSVTSKAVMPADTFYVEMRIQLNAPMRLHTKENQAGIRSLGIWTPPADKSLTQKTKITNDILNVVFDPNKMSLGVVDKRNGKKWDSLPLPSTFGLEKIATGKLEDGSSVITIQGVYLAYTAPYRITVMLAPNAPSIIYRTETDPNLRFPEKIGKITTVPSFIAPDDTHKLVLPASPNFLYSPSDKNITPTDWKFDANPAWAGITDAKGAAGMMYIVNSFQHASAGIRQETVKGKTGPASIDIHWNSFDGTWEYPRDVQIWFTDQGGQDALTEYFLNRKF